MAGDCSHIVRRIGRGGREGEKNESLLHCTHSVRRVGQW